MNSRTSQLKQNVIIKTHRVCGYSAYFVDLSKGLQNEIIKRTEQVPLGNKNYSSISRVWGRSE